MAGAATLDLGARLGAGTMTHIAGVPARNSDLGVLPTGSFLERDFHCIAEIVPAEHLLTAAGAAPLLASAARAAVSSTVAAANWLSVRASSRSSTPLPGCSAGRSRRESAPRT